MLRMTQGSGRAGGAGWRSGGSPSLVRLRPKRGAGGPPPPRRGGKVLPFPAGDWRALRRYWLVAAGLVAALGATSAAVALLHLPVLRQPLAFAIASGPTAAAAIALSLVSGIVVPLRSAAVMTAAGSVFGPLGGAALAFAGSVGASAVAFALGRRGSRLLGRLVGPAERLAADRLSVRHGTAALILTRPIPLLGEAVALLAGASPLPWGRAMLGASLGAVPVAALCAIAGAAGADPPALALTLAPAAVLGCVYVAVERMLERRED